MIIFMTIYDITLMYLEANGRSVDTAMTSAVDLDTEAIETGAWVDMAVSE